MVLWIRGGLGEPHHFLGVHRFAVDHGGHLAVAAPRVETDAAAFQMAAHAAGGGTGDEHLLHAFGLGYFKGTLVHGSHEIRIEGAFAPRLIGGFQVLIHRFGAEGDDAVAAPGPQQGFDHPVQQGHGARVLAVRENVHFVMIAVALIAHDQHAEGHAFAAGSHVLFVGAGFDFQGTKAGIQGSGNL